jgi:hypothetical protein
MHRGPSLHGKSAGACWLVACAHRPPSPPSFSVSGACRVMCAIAGGIAAAGMPSTALPCIHSPHNTRHHRLHASCMPRACRAHYHRRCRVYRSDHEASPSPMGRTGTRTGSHTGPSSRLGTPRSASSMRAGTPPSGSRVTIRCVNCQQRVLSAVVTWFLRVNQMPRCLCVCVCVRERGGGAPPAVKASSSQLLLQVSLGVTMHGVVRQRSRAQTLWPPAGRRRIHHHGMLAMIPPVIACRNTMCIYTHG